MGHYGVFYLKTALLAPWKSQELSRREKMVQNIAKHYLCLGPTNTNHFDLLRHLSMNMGAKGANNEVSNEG